MWPCYCYDRQQFIIVQGRMQGFFAQSTGLEEKKTQILQSVEATDWNTPEEDIWEGSWWGRESPSH